VILPVGLVTGMVMFERPPVGGLNSSVWDGPNVWDPSERHPD
jgi:hypothetical protein